jgi:hypothetical protein
MDNSGCDTAKLFRDGRLSPWKPDQNLVIYGWIGKYQIENPKYAEQMKALYDQKMFEHLQSLPKEPEVANVETPVVVAEQVQVEPVVAEVKPKRGRPSKKSSPTI